MLDARALLLADERSDAPSTEAVTVKAAHSPKHAAWSGRSGPVKSVLQNMELLW